MKTIGLLGGMSWESSLEYYRLINEEVKRRLGGLHSAQCLLWSFDLRFHFTTPPLYTRWRHWSGR